ncbi:MAG TPA: right-handed parallel beta-helix repeat-containing protein [Steroidobacteraceae bacterium]|nr:right-handed parallel beta-helix repeat-containing protein [Steroidobacteraceae bacterium]
MTHFVRIALTITASILFVTSLAHAQATRTWVSGVGDDVNPCSRTAPCKTFAGAISKTATGGEISVLDPGGFGAVNITKSITINGDGTLASILAAGTNGIIVNAPAGSVVTLRNLAINGAGTGVNGIRIIGASSVTIDKCDISGFTAAGIDVEPNMSSKVVIRDTFIRTVTTGVQITQLSVRLDVVMDDVTIKSAVHGVENQSGLTTITDSTIAQHVSNGVLASGGSVNIERTSITGNSTGAIANAGATIRLSNSGVYDNLVGLGCGAGILASTGDNRVGGNGGGGCAPNGVVTVQ